MAACVLPFVALLALSAPGVPTVPEDARVTRTVWLMGTEAHVEVRASEREEALRASEAAVAVMLEVESLLSTWRTDSHLSVLNRSPVGLPTRPRPRVGAWLVEMSTLVERTSGTVDPRVGALIDAWDSRGEGRIPSAGEREAALAASGVNGMLLDPITGTVTRLHAEAWLDAGAFGKGAALRAARDRMKDLDVVSATVDLGGQLLVMGAAPVTVAVANPLLRGREAARVQIADASVATSGQSERGFELDGRRYGHILDPRDGRPVSAWGSVTVVHPDPLQADALSTALYVMGPVEGFPWAESEGIAALFLEATSDGVVERATSSLEPHVDRGPTKPLRASPPGSTSG